MTEYVWGHVLLVLLLVWSLVCFLGGVIYGRWDESERREGRED